MGPEAHARPSRRRLPPPHDEAADRCRDVVVDFERERELRHRKQGVPSRREPREETKAASSWPSATPWRPPPGLCAPVKACPIPARGSDKRPSFDGRPVCTDPHHHGERGTSLPGETTRWKVAPRAAAHLDSSAYGHPMDKTVPDLFALRIDANEVTWPRALTGSRVRGGAGTAGRRCRIPQRRQDAAGVPRWRSPPVARDRASAKGDCAVGMSPWVSPRVQQQPRSRPSSDPAPARCARPRA
jgi:hypothetical protein